MCKTLWEGANFISGKKDKQKKNYIWVVSCDQSAVILITAAPHYKSEIVRLLLV